MSLLYSTAHNINVFANVRMLIVESRLFSTLDGNPEAGEEGGSVSGTQRVRISITVSSTRDFENDH